MASDPLLNSYKGSYFFPVLTAWRVRDPKYFRKGLESGSRGRRTGE